MGEETLTDEVSKSKATNAAVEDVHLKTEDSLNEKMEVESNGVSDVLDNGKNLEFEKTAVVVKGNEDSQDGKCEGESKTEAVEIEATGEENKEGAGQEKECKQKAQKDVDVNAVEDEKMTEPEEKVNESDEKKKEEQSAEGSKEEPPVEGSKEENDADEVEGRKMVKKAEEVEEKKEVEIAEEVDEIKEEVKDPDKLDESQDERNTDEIEMGEEEKNEEVSGEIQESEHDEGQFTNNKEKKVSKKRSRRKIAGGRRNQKKKEGDRVEEEETAKKKKGTETNKNKKEENKAENDEKELHHTPIMDRPVRERKSVERLVSIIEKDAHKEFKIEKGPGTPLKDIPNVASQLRRRNDETLRLLHNLLFGRRCKAFEIRGHISRFSGYVWHDNEENQRNKVKEKFDKCTKEKLLEICDVLDIQVSRASIKKEELVIKLIDFLKAPYTSTTVVLSEEPTHVQKRKRVVKQSSSGSAKQSVKSRKKNEDSSKKKNDRPPSDSDNASEENEEGPDDEVETENGIHEKSDDEMADQLESEEDVSEESGDKTMKRKSKAKSSGKKDSSGKVKNKKAVTVQISSRSNAADDGDRKVSSKKNEKGIKKSPSPAKSSGKIDAKGKGKFKDVKPSDKELRNAICEILKEVDFNTATFSDILKKLAKKFNMDLTLRKPSIKLMIEEELTKLAEEAEDDEDDDEGVTEKEEGDTGKYETVDAAEGTEVKA